MYRDTLLLGTSLPDKTLCLTFDDGPGETSGPGPGPRTLALAQYLNEQGVFATFFMSGKFAEKLPHILPQVRILGHIIGNHCYDHHNLVDYAASGGDVIEQIIRTDALIHDTADISVIFHRPPYGAWNADIARTLNSNQAASLNHAGPIGWDIDGSDWYFWSLNKEPQSCADHYLQLIEQKRHGIVLLHDCTADHDNIGNANRTLEHMQILIPELKKRGYQFSRLDAIPGIIADN